MADYVVKFTGQDNLTPTLNKIKGELSNTGNSANQLDKISQKLDRITSSAAAPKKQLKDLQDLMARMNLNGLSNTDVFAKAASEAAKLKDSIADASQATRLLSSDTANLDAGIQAVQGIAAAFSVATGAMGLFGVENEKVQQAILKVQSALAILNGVQQIANVLNKDSILVLKLQQLWQKLSAAATDQKTASTTKNTVVQELNTKAVKGSTLATKAWNVVTAISKALLGDWSGLLLVGVGALATWAITAERGSEAQERMNSSVKVFNTQAELMKKASETAGQLLGKYLQLKTEYNQLKNEMQKAQFIKDHANDFKDLALSIYSVADADKAFNQNTREVIDSIMKRAKAMAAYNLLMKASEDYINKLIYNRNTTAGGGFYKKAKVGDTYSVTEARQAGTYDSSRSGYKVLRVQTQQEATLINIHRQQQAQTRLFENNNTAEREFNAKVGFLTGIIKENATPTSSSSGSNSGRTTRGHTTKVTSDSDAAHQQQTILEDTIKDINELLHKRDYFIQVGIDDKEVKKQFDQLQKELKTKYQTVLDLKGNIFANPSVSMLQEYKRAIDTLRENSTDDEERRNLDKLSSEITKAIDRLNFSVKNIDLTLSDITGATGTAADISLFYKRLQSLQDKWDEYTEELRKLIKAGVVDEQYNDFAFMNDTKISDEEKEKLYNEQLAKVAEQDTKNKEKTEKYLKELRESNEQYQKLKQQQDIVGQGINAVERVIQRILQLGLNPNTDWWRDYKLTEEEKRIGIHKNEQLQIANILAAVNEGLANVDVTTGKTRKTSAEIEVPAYYKQMLYYQLINKTDYLNQILDWSQIYQILKQLRESFKNPYSDATIRIEFEGTDPEKLEKIQEFLLNKESQVQWSSNRLEIEGDIQSYQEQLDQLKHDSIFDGISAVTGLANSWEGLSRTLEGTGSVFSKVMATVDTIMNTLVQLERFTESFKEIKNLTDSISSANDYLAQVKEAQNLAEQAVYNTTTASQSTELASSKTAEAAAHTANATAIGTETGAMTALATSQGAATASALALYAATKKAAAASIFAAHAYIPFAGVGIATGFVAEMESVLAAISAFANGGIVGGTSYSGDKILTRLNSGEMVLNRTQQGNLFNLLNNGIGGTGQVEFKIKGQELVGVLNNYNNKFNKVK